MAVLLLYENEFFKLTVLASKIIQISKRASSLPLLLSNHLLLLLASHTCFYITLGPYLLAPYPHQLLTLSLKQTPQPLNLHPLKYISLPTIDQALLFSTPASFLQYYPTSSHITSNPYDLISQTPLPSYPQALHSAKSLHFTSYLCRRKIPPVPVAPCNHHPSIFNLSLWTQNCTI